MKLPLDTPKIIQFKCNICGQKNQIENDAFHRELAICKKCKSNARFRGIIFVLADSLGLESKGQKNDLTLVEWPISKKNIRNGDE